MQVYSFVLACLPHINVEAVPDKFQTGHDMKNYTKEVFRLIPSFSMLVWFCNKLKMNFHSDLAPHVATIVKDFETDGGSGQDNVEDATLRKIYDAVAKNTAWAALQGVDKKQLERIAADTKHFVACSIAELVDPSFMKSAVSTRPGICLIVRIETHPTLLRSV